MQPGLSITAKHPGPGQLRAVDRHVEARDAAVAPCQVRIVVFFALLLVLVQGAAFLLVNAANTDNAHGVIDKELAMENACSA